MPRTLIRKKQLENLQIINADVAVGAAIATDKLAEGLDFIKRNGSVPFTANQSMAGFLLQNVGVPLADTDVTNKKYVDDLIDGLVGDLDLYQLLSEKNQALGYAGLDSGGKLFISQLPDFLFGQLQYQGQWDAATNTPTLPDPTTVKGHYYVTQVEGTQFGHFYSVGDWVVSDGVKWDYVDNSDAVTSVFGRLGNVVANAADYAAYYYPLSTNPAGYLTSAALTPYALKDGTNATGTWPIGISGTAANATTWSGIPADFSATFGTIPTHLFGYDAPNNLGKIYQLGAVQTSLNINDGSTLSNHISGTAANATTWNGNSYSLGGVTTPSYFITGLGASAWGYSSLAEVKAALGIATGGETLQTVINRSPLIQNNNYITYRSNGDDVVQFQNAAGTLQGYIGKLASGAITILNGVSGQSLNLNNSAIMTHTGLFENSGRITVKADGANLLLKKLTAGEGTGNNYITFQSSINTEEGYMGYGAATADFYIRNSVGDIQYSSSGIHNFNSNVHASYFHMSGPVVDAVGLGYFVTTTSADNYLRKSSASAVQTALGLGTAAYKNFISGDGTSSSVINKVAAFDANGYLYTYYINSSTANGEGTSGSINQIIFTNGSDGFYRKASLSQLATALSGTPGGETLQTVLSRGQIYTGARDSDWAMAVTNTGTTGANGVYVNIGSSSTGVIFRTDKAGVNQFSINNDGDGYFANKVTILGDIGLGGNPVNGGSNARWAALHGTGVNYSGGLVYMLDNVIQGYSYYQGGYVKVQADSGNGVKLIVNGSTDALTVRNNTNSIFSGDLSIGTEYGLSGYRTLSLGSSSVTGLMKFHSAYNSGNGAEFYQEAVDGKIYWNINSGFTGMTLNSSGGLFVAGSVATPYAQIGAVTIGGGTSNVQVDGSSNLIFRPGGSAAYIYFQKNDASINWAYVNGAGFNGNLTGAIWNGSAHMTFNWAGQPGQPSYVWGSNGNTEVYVYNPSNFNVASSNLLNALPNYIWSESMDATAFPLGISNSFVQGGSGQFPSLSYGSMMVIRSYGSGPGSTLQLYSPYSPTYGGNNLKIRIGNYDTADWTSWKTLANISDITDMAQPIGPYLKATAGGPNAEVNYFLSIGNNGSTRAHLQSHSMPLDINPLGNQVTINGMLLDSGANASTIATRNSSGYLFAQYFNMGAYTSTETTPAIIAGFSGSDGYIRPYTASSVGTLLGLNTGGSLTNNISGTALHATNWGGVPADFSASINTTPGYIVGLTSGIVKPYNAGAILTFLGSPSTGETLATVTARGATATGAITATDFNTTTGWFYSNAATGWYNNTYGGGIYMNDTTWVKVYNGKNFQCDYVISGGQFTVVSSGGYRTENYGVGMVGLYDASRYQEVFSMGAAYRPSTDGMSVGTSYGILWTHTNAGGQSKAGLEHQALFTMAGVTQTAIGQGIWTRGIITGTTDLSIGGNAGVTGNVTAASYVQGLALGVSSSAGTGAGLSLYGGSTGTSLPNYGLASGNTSSFGTHGAVSGDWATYSTMSGGTDRGWIFMRRDSSNWNVASISASGYATFDDYSQSKKGHVVSYSGTVIGGIYNGNIAGAGGNDDLVLLSSNNVMIGGGGYGDFITITDDILYVGMSNPSSSLRLDVGGNIRAYDFIVNSDITLKKNVVPLRDSLEKIMKLTGYNYNLKLDNSASIGLIAQEVEEIFPELVHTKGTKGVEYGKLVAPLIMAIKELKQEIEQLKTQLN